MKHLILPSCGFAILAAGVVARAVDSDEVPTYELIKDASRVLELAQRDNVAAEAQAAAVFVAAERLAKEKKDSEARRYFEAGLRLSPWRAEYYLTYADLLSRLGEKSSARRWAMTMYERAEDDAAREKARKWLGLPEAQKIPLLPEKSPERLAICIVPVGKPPKWLVHQCGIALANLTGLAVYHQEEAIGLPPPSRNGMKHWVAKLKDGLRWEDPALTYLCRDLGFEFKGNLMPDHQIIAIYEEIFKRQGNEEALADFRKTKSDLAQDTRNQWDARKLLETLAAVSEKSPVHRIMWVGLTEVDIYLENNNYLFGLSSMDPRMKYALVSCCRFMADFNDEPPDARRLATRTVKQMLSGIGNALGAQRPLDPTCPRSYPNSLPQHDAKTLNLCDDCRKSFSGALGGFVLPPMPDDPFKAPRP